MILSLTTVFGYENNSCANPGDGKITIHIRSIMTRENEQESKEFADVLQAAADHVNNIEGILEGYYLCFKWDHAQVSFWAGYQMHITYLSHAHHRDV